MQTIYLSFFIGICILHQTCCLPTGLHSPEFLLRVGTWTKKKDAATAFQFRKLDGIGRSDNRFIRAMNRRGRLSFLLSASKDAEGPNIFSRRTILSTLGCLVLALPPLLEVYSRLGTKDTDIPRDLLAVPSKGNWNTVTQATLVFHGSGGQDQYTDRLMKNLHQYTNSSNYSTIIEWSQFSTNILQASFNGQRVGRLAATELMKKAPNLKSLHIIGISVGAFAADAACYQAKSTTMTTASTTAENSPYVQLTLLDPFTQRGFFDVGYGARQYGRSADYFQQYLNTDDPVPSTNVPLANGVCFDITSIRPEEISFGHDWPVAYYAQKGDVGIVPPEQRLKRGSVITVS